MPLTAPLLLSLLSGCVDRPAVDRPALEQPPEPEPPPCLGTPPCELERRLTVNTADGPRMVVYDYLEVTRRVRLAKLSEESGLSVAVRLLLGEVGPERLLTNRHAQQEALGVLSTVHNRLDASVWNPEDKSADHWPSCGEEASFSQCADPEQYLGLKAWRALHPADHVSDEYLEPAVEAAVAAWWLLDQDLVADPTKGATSFVHRCGGLAYGEPTNRCDGAGEDDIEGAETATGPIVFRGPERWDAEQGRYLMWRTHEVEFETR